MIRPCNLSDSDTMVAIINEAAQAYKGIIPTDRWREPYMTKEELIHELGAGVSFWCSEEGGLLLGVMGIQQLEDVTLIRHAYVRSEVQNSGIGSKLLCHLKTLTTQPILIGTWAAARWAILFYEKHGFSIVSEEEKDILLRKYWQIPPRQVETSVVLAER